MPTLQKLIAAALVSTTMLATVCRAADYTVHVIEPAVTNHLILPEGPLPPVCKQTSLIALSGCRGEYEPASFVVTAATPLEQVRIEVAPLRGTGDPWPDDAVDLRVVKSYHTRTTAGPVAAVPMLLVHDDTILTIESDPTPENPDQMKHVAHGPLRDAPQLQPVNIDKRRQFWLTVQIPDHAEPGTYRTTVRISPANGAPTELTLHVEVYPFDLSAPMLEYSIYYPVALVPDGAEDWSRGKWNNGARLTRQQYIAECRNMVAHGMANPNIYGGVGRHPDGSLDYSRLEIILAVREEAGIGPGVPLYTMSAAAEPVSRALTESEKAERVQIVREIMAWAKRRGYPDFFWVGQDEAWGDWLAKERDSFQAIHDGGGKVFVACSGDFFQIVGDVLHRPVLHIDINEPVQQFGAVRNFGPDDALRQNAATAEVISFERQVNHPAYRRAIDGVHRLGRKIYTYTTLRPPLPQWQRRFEGLGLWRIGFDGVMNWAYAHINGDGAQQAMYFAMVYRTENGVLDTLHWEGFREGVDDVRYLTTLLAALNQTLGRFPGEPLIAETNAWLKDLDVAGGDLDGIRREMAQRIIALQDLGHKDLTPEQLLGGVDLTNIEIVAIDDPWRFKLLEVDQSILLRSKPAASDEGVAHKWFDPAADDSAWTPVRVGEGYTLGKGGGWGNQPGFGWYRTALPLTDAHRARQFKYLHFAACDEDARVYLNGQQIFEHTIDNTGLMTSEIWREPFVVPLYGKTQRGEDLLAVRVRNTEAMGGIWKPVHLVVTDQKLSDQQVKALFSEQRIGPEN